MRSVSCLYLLLVSLMLVAAGCRQAGPPPAPPPPTVTVAHPVRRDIADHREYSGAIEAVESVDIRARVRGFLRKINFQEGAQVHRNDVLYEVDPSEFQAAVERAQADLERLQAQLVQAESELKRVEKLRGTAAISPEEYTARVAARDIAKAQVKQAQAALETARLDLDYATIRAPIDGQIGRTLVTVGNLVGYNEPTLLTTIVRMDPVYVTFEPPESDYLEYRRLMREQNLPSATQEETPVYVGLINEDDFPHKGTINFRDNRVDFNTGTVLIRGTIPNPHRVLLPGLFARVRVPFGRPQPRVLVPQSAIGADQRGRYVLVVDANKTVEYRPVTTGLTTEDQLVAIEKGIAADDWIVINGLQKARPGAPVTAEVAAIGQGTGSGVRRQGSGIRSQEGRGQNDK